MSLEDSNIDNEGDQLHKWLMYGIVPPHVYPLMEEEFNNSTENINPQSDSGSVPSFIQGIEDERLETGEKSDKSKMPEGSMTGSLDLALEGDSSQVYDSPFSQDPFVECFMSASGTNDDISVDSDFTPGPTRRRGPVKKGPYKKRGKRVRKKKLSSSSATSTPSEELQSSSLQKFSPTPITPVAPVKKSKDGESSGIFDGSNGWTDLKSNRFLRRQFFDYFNENKVECLQCPPDRERRTFRPTYNLVNYYYTSKPNVPLESYYYGLCTGRDIDTIDSCPKILKCPDCKESVDKTDVFRHIVAHMKWKENASNALQARVCKYCLSPVKATSNMDSHINKCHKIFSDVGHCCRICSTAFENEIKTTVHMWEKHYESEMPYKCSICDYRSSFLDNVVDHVDRTHSHMKRLICPICLKCFPFTVLDEIFNNLKQHVMGHMLKAENVDCSSCALRFVNDFDYIQHRTDKILHKSGKDCNGFERYEVPSGTVCLMMAQDPKSIEVEEIPCIHLRESQVEAKIEKIDWKEIDSHEKVFSRVMQQMNPSPVKVPQPPKY